MLTGDVLRKTVASAGIEAPPRFDEVTESTNATALAMAEDGAPEWTVVAAGHQTFGRGRLGRRWESEPGAALLFSVLLRPRVGPDRATLLTLLAGTAMAGACRDVAGAEVRCKWPNDLLLDDRKVGGVLAEASVAGGDMRYVVVGVGLNLGTPPAGVPDAGAIPEVPPERVLGGFLQRFRARYRPGDEGFARTVVAEYLAVAATVGRRVRARTTGGDSVEGVAEDVGDDGALLVRTDAGLRRVGFGEVEHLR